MYNYLQTPLQSSVYTTLASTTVNCLIDCPDSVSCSRIVKPCFQSGTQFTQLLEGGHLAVLHSVAAPIWPVQRHFGVERGGLHPTENLIEIFKSFYSAKPTFLDNRLDSSHLILQVQVIMTFL